MMNCPPFTPRPLKKAFSLALAGGIMLFQERSTNIKSSAVTIAVFESTLFVSSSADKGGEQRLIEIKIVIHLQLQWL